MTNRKQAVRQRGISILVLAVLIAVPTASVADNARALQVLGQGLQKMAEDQQRREREQEKLRIQQEQLELQRKRMQAAEQERLQAQQQVKEAEQRALQGERATRAEAEKTKRIEEQTPPDAYSGIITIHRDALKPASVDQPPLMTIPNFAWFSPDGTKAVWTEASKTLKLWDIARNTVRGIATPQPGEALLVHFVGNDALAVQVSAPQWSAILIDLEGRVVRNWPTNTHTGHANDHTFTVKHSEKGEITKIGLFDAKGVAISELDVRGMDVAANEAREDGFHVIARKGQDIHYFRNGQLIRQFSGDSRGDPSKYRVPIYSFISQSPRATPYAVSTMTDDNRFMLWDLAQGRLVCSGTRPGTDYSPFTWPEGSAWIIVGSAPPAAVDPANCSVQIIGSPGDRLSWAKDRAFLANAATGRVSELDPVSFQVKKTFDTGLSRSATGEHKPYMYANADADDPGILVVGLYEYDKRGVIQLHDADSGQLLAKVPAWGRLRKGSDYVQSVDHGKIGDRHVTTTRIWKRSAVFNRPFDAFLKSAAKDPFETTGAWNKRVASLRLTHRIALDLSQYDADQARFEAKLHGVPMSLPLPPDVARQLAGAKTVDLEGELKVLDANFFELANAKVLLPDGKTHAIVPKACPKTLAELLALPSFQHPRLATLRRQIHATSVADTLEKARNAGFDRQAAIAATRNEVDRYTEEVQRIAATKDAVVAADLSIVDKLPLGYACKGPKGETVCRYIEQMWRAMAAEAMAGAMACR